MAGVAEIITAVANLAPAVISLLQLGREERWRRDDERRQQQQQPNYYQPYFPPPQYYNYPPMYPVIEGSGVSREAINRQREIMFNIIKQKKREKPIDINKIKTALEMYGTMNTSMRQQLRDYLPEHVIKNLDEVYKAFKESNLSEEEK
jgi:hypothetical protein